MKSEKENPTKNKNVISSGSNQHQLLMNIWTVDSLLVLWGNTGDREEKRVE